MAVTFWLTLILLLPGRLSLADIQLTQANGETLQLESAARSIITLAPHLTELAFEVGAGEQILATVEYSEYPESAKTIPRVGDAFRLDLERILTLKPDLVIAWDSGNPQAAINRLKALGLVVWTLEIRRPEDIANSLKQFGLATGNDTEAKRAANSAENQLNAIKLQFSGSSPVKYFFQVATGPLYTLNGAHIISQGLTMCGGINIFSDENVIAPQVSHESVIAADPQVMFAGAISEQDDPLARWREWPNLQAVRNDALFLLPADQINRASSRWLDALSRACTLLDENRNRSQHE